MFKPCIIIPIYNHGETTKATLAKLQPYGIQCVLVNDASNDECTETLRHLAAQYDWILLVEHTKNKGKGGAVKTGFKAALQAGFSHGLQVDADGQHNLDDIAAFLTAAENNPDSIIAGAPIFDDSVPKLRKYARYLTHGLVWLNTLSLTIKDSMCGFRVYPLKAVIEVMDHFYLGDRMDFDVEVLVKSHWFGIAIMSKPTQVLYPEDGVSHFSLFRDNALISWMHIRLFFGMLKHLPLLLKRQMKKESVRE